MKQTFLFQGDSITDVGRREDPRSLGEGYVRVVADTLTEVAPEAEVLNRGISGDRTWDLLERWQQDCIDLAPDLVTIFIGINDCWRKYDSGMETTPEQFEANYRSLLRWTREGTRAEIVLMEPFVLPVPEDRRAWRETLDPQIQIVRALAREFGTRLVTLDASFAKAALIYDYDKLAEDGVHPTPTGHRLIADEWLRACGFE